jgi:catechol 2,3-dioxygenase-like lactoylglutathione lyase family enzyme
MPIYTHAVIGTNDIEHARTFYDAVLAPLGIKRLGNTEQASFYGIKTPELVVTKPIDGNPATGANGGTISFAAPSRAAVNSFHESALANGGQCAGAPGPRPVAETAYAAYVRDAVGNKIAAYCFAAE